MTFRPVDWSPLDYGSDPVPGDPDAVRRGGDDYVLVADSIRDAAASLRSIQHGGDTSQATNELLKNAGDVADSISKAEGRYRETGLALRAYAPRLAAAQSDSLDALHAAEQAAESARTASANRVRYLQLADEQSGDEEEAGHYRDLATAALTDDDDATGGLAAAKQRVETAIDDRDRAADAAVDRISAITGSDGLKDSGWDDWGKDLLSAITDIAGWVSTIAGILALCVSWIPVVGQVLGAALLIIAGVAAVINAIGNVVLASTGDRSWTEAGISIAGAVLSVVGVGGAARVIGKVAVVSRINRVAAVQRLGPGEAVDLIPLRNANRYSIGQLREAEAAWRSPVPDFSPDAPLYRLYGGGSRQLGGSFGSVDPMTLDYPHSTLGLPANNTMERMAVFEVNPGATPVNVRHALPYEGTLGGAPEYVFPRGAGTTVVDDAPFVAP